MKTNLLPLALALLCLSAIGCRKPSLPNGEPTIKTVQPEKPAIQLLWRVVKGSRLAYSHPLPALGRRRLAAGETEGT